MGYELRPQEGAQEKALNSTADVVIYGGAAGAGKSYMALLKTLMYVDDPYFKSVVFRRTGPQLSGAGGLWDEAKSLYLPWKPRLSEQDRLARFKAGASVKFSHMEYSKNRLDH